MSPAYRTGASTLPWPVRWTCRALWLAHQLVNLVTFDHQDDGFTIRLTAGTPHPADVQRQVGHFRHTQVGSRSSLSGGSWNGIAKPDPD